jgi:hypothetical protein
MYLTQAHARAKGKGIGRPPRTCLSGEESIERIAQMFAGHDINQLRQIDAILAPKEK